MTMGRPIKYTGALGVWYFNGSQYKRITRFVFCYDVDTLGNNLNINLS